METFELHIWAPDRPFYDGVCESLVLPTVDGQYGVMAHHSNAIAAVVPGELGYTVPGEAKKYAAVGAGIVKIEDNTVHVLVETAERPEEIDVNRAEKDAEAAREALLQKQSRREYYTTKISLARAMGRLRTRAHSIGGDAPKERL